jgi:Flp pilus assembly protein TadD
LIGNHTAFIPSLEREGSSACFSINRWRLSLKTPRSGVNRGSALGCLGRYKEALASFEKAIDLEPNCQRAWGEKSYALLLLGRKKEAD